MVDQCSDLYNRARHKDGVSYTLSISIVFQCMMVMPSCYIAAVCDLSQYINSKLLSRSEHAPVFIYIAESEIIAPQEATMAQLYQYREDDYFLYLAYYKENHYQDKTKPPMPVAQLPKKTCMSTTIKLIMCVFGKTVIQKLRMH